MAEWLVVTLRAGGPTCIASLHAGRAALAAGARTAEARTAEARTAAKAGAHTDGSAHISDAMERLGSRIDWSLVT